MKIEKNLPGMDAIKSSSRPNLAVNEMNVASLNHAIYLSSMDHGRPIKMKFSDGAIAECIEFKRDKYGDMTVRVIGIGKFLYVTDDMALIV